MILANVFPSTVLCSGSAEHELRSSCECLRRVQRDPCQRLPIQGHAGSAGGASDDGQGVQPEHAARLGRGHVPSGRLLRGHGCQWHHGVARSHVCMRYVPHERCLPQRRMLTPQGPSHFLASPLESLSYPQDDSTCWYAGGCTSMCASLGLCPDSRSCVGRFFLSFPSLFYLRFLLFSPFRVGVPPISGTSEHNIDMQFEDVHFAACPQKTCLEGCTHRCTHAHEDPKAMKCHCLQNDSSLST